MISKIDAGAMIVMGAIPIVGWILHHLGISVPVIEIAAIIGGVFVGWGIKLLITIPPKK